MGFSFGAKNNAATHARKMHPVDIIEQLADAQGWTFERVIEDEITAKISGNAVDYDISFSWLEEHETLHLSCAFSLKVPAMRESELMRLLAQINEKLLFGHFDYWKQADQVIYRQTLLLSGGLHPTHAQIKTLLMTALDACETHYGACRSILADNVTAKEALRHALFETHGNA